MICVDLLYDDPLYDDQLSRVCSDLLVLFHLRVTKIQVHCLPGPITCSYIDVGCPGCLG